MIWDPMGTGAFNCSRHRAKDISAVLWVGPTDESSLGAGWWKLRDPGTPEVQPRYDKAARCVQPGRRPAGDRRIADRHGRAPGCCSCSTHPTRSSGGRHLLFSQPDWLVEAAGGIARPRCAVTPSSRSGSGRRHDERRRRARGHVTNYGNMVLDGWAAWRRRTVGRPGHRARAGGAGTVEASHGPEYDVAQWHSRARLLPFAAALVGWSGFVAPGWLPLQ